MGEPMTMKNGMNLLNLTDGWIGGGGVMSALLELFVLPLSFPPQPTKQRYDTRGQTLASQSVSQSVTKIRIAYP